MIAGVTGRTPDRPGGTGYPRSAPAVAPAPLSKWPARLCKKDCCEAPRPPARSDRQNRTPSTTRVPDERPWRFAGRLRQRQRFARADCLQSSGPAQAFSEACGSGRKRCTRESPNTAAINVTDDFMLLTPALASVQARRAGLGTTVRTALADIPASVLLRL